MRDFRCSLQLIFKFAASRFSWTGREFVDFSNWIYIFRKQGSWIPQLCFAPFIVMNGAITSIWSKIALIKNVTHPNSAPSSTNSLSLPALWFPSLLSGLDHSHPKGLSNPHITTYSARTDVASSCRRSKILQNLHQNAAKRTQFFILRVQAREKYMITGTIMILYSKNVSLIVKQFL